MLTNGYIVGNVWKYIFDMKKRLYYWLIFPFDDISSNNPASFHRIFLIIFMFAVH